MLHLRPEKRCISLRAKNVNKQARLFCKILIVTILFL